MQGQGKLIDLKGLQQTNRLLKEVAPDLRRQMFREIGGMVKARVTAAKDKMPSRTGRLIKETYLTKSGAKRDISGGRKQGLFGFVAISAAPYATVLDLMANANLPRTEALLATLNQNYGNAPRFLGGQFLPAGEGGTVMWRESKQIVERYISEANRAIENAANTTMVS